jgi:hypothetical protein
MISDFVVLAFAVGVRISRRMWCEPLTPAARLNELQPPVEGDFG